MEQHFEISEDDVNYTFKHVCDDGDDECMACAVRDCPCEDPLHYHHDGCPSCYFDEEEECSI